MNACDFSYPVTDSSAVPARSIISRACALFALLLGLSWQAGAQAACPADFESLTIGGGLLCLSFSDAGSAGNRALLLPWITRSAQIVANFYGMFPGQQVLLVVGSMDGSGVGGGRTTNDPLRIRVRVGRSSSAADLAADWVLVHEMVHLALPEVGPHHDWLAEGLATYVEGVARAQAGNRSVQDVWAEARGQMPAGLPRPGEGGMDETESWGRTYWGGALFCLESDIAIRERTHDRFGLQDALRAILRETGGYASERGIAGVLKIGDEATHTRVLQEFYERSRRTPRMTDLNDLWQRLGVPADPLHQPFDDQAPLASIRKAITQAR
jgi:hypothetical protein